MVSSISAQMGINVLALTQTSQKGGLQTNSSEEQTESASERIKEALTGEGPETSGTIGTIVNKLV